MQRFSSSSSLSHSQSQLPKSLLSNLSIVFEAAIMSERTQTTVCVHTYVRMQAKNAPTIFRSKLTAREFVHFIFYGNFRFLIEKKENSFRWSGNVKSSSDS